MNLKDADPITKVRYGAKKPQEQMPYKSKAQEAFFHSPAAAKSNITPDIIEDFDSASAGKSLPDKAPKKSLPNHLKQRIAVRRALKK